MVDYPDWVLKHKKKGTYINRVGDKYYLYAAHSERVPGTKKVKLVHDGYIGRITEHEGLIPVRDKVQGEVIVYEFGLCMTLLDLCYNVHTGLRREFRTAADWILVAGILSAAYGDYYQETYHWSFLSVKFPGLDMQKALTDKQRFGLQRCERMVKEIMRKRFGDDLPAVMARLMRIYQVNINNQFYASTLSEEVKEWLMQQNIDWRDWLGKDRKHDSPVQRNVKQTTDHPVKRGRPQKTDT
jgi:hypothetical protein